MSCKSYVSINVCITVHKTNYFSKDASVMTGVVFLINIHLCKISCISVYCCKPVGTATENCTVISTVSRSID